MHLQSAESTWPETSAIHIHTTWSGSFFSEAEGNDFITFHCTKQCELSS